MACYFAPRWRAKNFGVSRTFGDLLKAEGRGQIAEVKKERGEGGDIKMYNQKTSDFKLLHEL